MSFLLRLKLPKDHNGILGVYIGQSVLTCAQGILSDFSELGTLWVSTAPSLKLPDLQLRWCGRFIWTCQPSAVTLGSYGPLLSPMFPYPWAFQLSDPGECEGPRGDRHGISSFFWKKDLIESKFFRSVTQHAFHYTPKGRSHLNPTFHCYTLCCWLWWTNAIAWVIAENEVAVGHRNRGATQRSKAIGVTCWKQAWTRFSGNMFLLETRKTGLYQGNALWVVQFCLSVGLRTAEHGFSDFSSGFCFAEYPLH